MAGTEVSRKVDPITLASVWNGLIAAADEVGIAIRSTAFTEAIREGDDFSVGVFDGAGRMVAQGNFSPGHLGAMPFTMKQFLLDWPLDTWAPGDAVITNDPLIGTGHFPDFCMAVPVFFGDRAVAFAVATCHHIDVGGAAPGSQQVEGIRDFFQEGLHVPPVRLYRKGERVRDVFRIIGANSREERILDDFLAQRNALEHHGVPRLRQLFRTHGAEVVEACFDEMIERTEAAVRAEIRKLPRGTYTYTNFLDDYGPGTPRVKVNVAVQIEGDEIAVDFAGSSPQVPAGINSYISYTRAYVYCALRCVLTPSVPQNEGGIRPIRVTAPEGSYFNPHYGAGCGARAMNSMRIAESVLAALAPVSPRAVAAYGGWSHFCFGGIDPRTGRRVVGTEILAGGHGARRDKDGLDFLVGPFNINNLPAECWEAAFPLRVEKLQVAVDSEGAGTHRGSPGIYKEIRFFMDDWTFANLTEKEGYVPPGLSGGMAGMKGTTVLVRDGEERALEGKGTYTGMKRGDLIKVTVGGGAGWGDPLERDPRAVWDDVVVHRFVSVEGARTRYGVVIDPVRLELRLPETERLRETMKAAR
jgi:N-methylhydantoinase B